MALELYPWIHPETGQSAGTSTPGARLSDLKPENTRATFVTLRGKMGENLAAEKIKMSSLV